MNTRIIIAIVVVVVLVVAYLVVRRRAKKPTGNGDKPPPPPDVSPAAGELFELHGISWGQRGDTTLRLTLVGKNKISPAALEGYALRIVSIDTSLATTDSPKVNAALTNRILRVMAAVKPPASDPQNVVTVITEPINLATSPFAGTIVSGAGTVVGM